MSQTQLLERTEQKTDVTPTWSLILHNDDVNSFEHVITTLMHVCHHDATQATQAAYLVHYTGRTEVKRGEYDVLKDMKLKLQGADLTVSMEQL